MRCGSGTQVELKVGQAKKKFGFQSYKVTLDPTPVILQLFVKGYET